jgi:hypothetical protein
MFRAEAHIGIGTFNLGERNLDGKPLQKAAPGSNLAVNCAGARSAGTPHVTRDEAGTRKAAHGSGYQFQIIGEPEEDLLVLLGRLIENIRRGLSRKHLKKDKYGVQMADRIVCGKIGWDDAQDGSVPLLNIDGREIAWEEFGRMLMTFEGWQFKLEIRDKSEEF